MMEPVTKIVNAVRLQQAVLCTDCDVISDSPHDTCLVCGSHSLLPLARALGNVHAVSKTAVAKNAFGQPELPDNVLVLRLALVLPAAAAWE
jgi:hypothetical protein